MTDRQVARIAACELQFDISNEDMALLDRVLVCCTFAATRALRARPVHAVFAFF